MSLITNWYGRLGNNIQQISNAIYYCNKNQIDFSFLYHPLINNFYIDKKNKSLFSSRFFYFKDDIRDFECDYKELNTLRREICLKHISNNLNIPIFKKLPDSTLVIHIRGGDIFTKNPHPAYVQNPLCFYEKIISLYKEIIIVTQDYNNPIINYLKKKKNVKIQISDIKKDFATLMAAQNLASSGVGTFSISAALCSLNIRNFYCTNLYKDHHLNPEMLYNNDINVMMTMINKNKYIREDMWKNTEDQNKLMIHYKMKDIIC